MTVAVASALAVLNGTPAAAEGEILGASNPTAIKDSYIVVLKDGSAATFGVDALSGDLAGKYGGMVGYTYRHALRGFDATMTERQARRLAADPAVAFVQQNGTMRMTDTQPNPPSWGLNRIDQRDLPLDTSYTYPNTGSNVTAYVIDTGIRVTHQDFGGRATWGTNTTGDGNNTDCNGHGTHVAATIGGSQFGVAKGVSLVAVKVLDCAGSGSFAGVAQGIDFVTGQHAAGVPAVANMSLGAQGSDAATETAVRNSINDGVVYAIASGNSNADACNFTPARVTEAITVNASTIGDARASFSNFGTCTDIFAPGQDITSAWNTSDTATNTISGTSMATPHVAGAAALLLNPQPLPPGQVAAALVANSTPNKIVPNPPPGTPNRLLFVNVGGQPGNPAVTNPGNQTGTVGTPVSLQLSASGGTPPYTWSATGLPAGLSVNSSTGLISGTPATANTFSVTATATDTGNRSGSASFSWTINPQGACPSPGQKLVNPGFESGTTGWANATWTIAQWTGAGAPRSGIRSSWISGYGFTQTETLQQTVTIPAGCTNSVLSLWLKITTDEFEPIVFDTFTITVGSTVLATYTNLNPSPYTLRSFNVGAFAGQTVTVSFTGAEDWSLQTSFVLDDLSLTAG